MEHREAVDKVFGLIPGMKGRDPGEVLTEYAMKHRLAPAQFQKMAQVYNTTSTLYSRQQDRNAIPQLVDAPALLDRYMNKAASARVRSGCFLDDAPEEPIEKAASAVTTAPPTELPDYWSGKEAHAPLDFTPEAPGPDYRTQLSRMIPGISKAADDAVNALFDLDNDQNRLIERIKKAAENGDRFVMCRLERDAIGLSDESSRPMFDMLESCAKEAGISHVRERDAKLPDVVLHRDTTGFYDEFSRFSDSMKAAAACHLDVESRLNEFVKVAAQADPQTARTFSEDVTRLTRPLAQLLKVAAARKREEEDLPDPKGRVGSIDLNRRQAQSLLRREVQSPATDEDVLNIRDEEIARNQLQLPKAFLEDLSSATTDGLRSVRENASRLVAPDGWLDRTTQPFGERMQQRHRDEQRSIDRSEVEIRGAANLRRLLVTDEVISEVPPEAAVEAYNSIMLSAPEVVTDLGLLKLQLRQAVQHQGYDIDTATAARKFDSTRGDKGDKKDS